MILFIKRVPHHKNEKYTFASSKLKRTTVETNNQNYLLKINSIQNILFITLFEIKM